MSGGPDGDGREETSIEAASPYVPAFDVVLQAAKEGDSAAFAQLYQAMNRRVHGFARLRGAHDPEGLVNDVFLKVFRGLDTFTGNEAQFNAWVFTITRHALIDEARRQSRRPIETELNEAAVGEVDGIGNAETDALDVLAEASTVELLEKLTPDQRDVVVLRVVGDLTLEATAEALAKPLSAVKALQRRAFRRLAQEISAEGVSK